MKNPLELVKQSTTYWQDDQRMLCGGGFEEWQSNLFSWDGREYVCGLGFYLQVLVDEN